MKVLSSIDNIAFAELLDLCRAREPRPPFGENGSITRQMRAGNAYWYHRGYARSADGTPGKASLTYVGAVGDPAAEAVVVAHARRHASYRKRRDLASRLRRAGLPAPLPVEGAAIQALTEAGVFDSGSVLVGSVAFQTYGGLLGIRLDEARYRTDDIDLGRPLGLRLRGVGHADDVLAALRRADPTFVPLFHAGAPDLVAGFGNAANLKIEFLSPMRRGSAGDVLADTSGIAGVGAQQLKYLEYLLKDPVDAVVLHEAGVAVRVPDPMRYAVHKLMVAVMRGRNPAKARKDIAQAETLVAAARAARSERQLGLAWLEAWTRGPAWRRLLREGTLRLTTAGLDILADCVRQAAAADGVDCPFEDQADGRSALPPISP